MARSSLSLTLYTPRFHDSHGSCGARGLLGGNVTQALRLSAKIAPIAARAYHTLSIDKLPDNLIGCRNNTGVDRRDTAFNWAGPSMPALAVVIVVGHRILSILGHSGAHLLETRTKARPLYRIQSRHLQAEF